MEVGALLGGPSHYDDAQACSNVPTQRDELASDPTTLVVPSKTRVEVIEAGRDEGGAAQVTLFRLVWPNIASRRNLRELSPHGGNNIAGGTQAAPPPPVPLTMALKKVTTQKRSS
jgi:hypothetical protein